MITRSLGYCTCLYHRCFLGFWIFPITLWVLMPGFVGRRGRLPSLLWFYLWKAFSNYWFIMVRHCERLTAFVAFWTSWVDFAASHQERQQHLDRHQRHSDSIQTQPLWWNSLIWDSWVPINSLRALLDVWFPEINLDESIGSMHLKSLSALTSSAKTIWPYTQSRYPLI